MARIVPGYPEPQEPGFAFLAGYEGARKQRVEEQQAQQLMQLRQMQLMLQMQDAQVRHAYQKARTQELLNEQAASGDMAALRTLALRQQMHPDQQLAEDVLGNLEKLPPKFQKEAASIYGEMIQTQKAQEAYQGVGKEIERAAEDGLIDEAGLQTYQQRLQAKQQSGESPDDILTEFSSARQKRATDAANSEENMKAFEQARTALESAPPGRNRKLAEIALKEYELSPSRQREEGAGAKMLGAVQKALVGSVQEQQDQEFRDQFAQLSPMMQSIEEQRAFARSMKSGEPSPLGVPESRKRREGAGKGWTGHPRDWPEADQGKNVPRGTSGPAAAESLTKAWQESYGDANAVVDAAKEMGLDVEDPRVQAYIQEVLSQVTSGDSR